MSAAETKDRPFSAASRLKNTIELSIFAKEEQFFEGSVRFFAHI